MLGPNYVCDYDLERNIQIPDRVRERDFFSRPLFRALANLNPEQLGAAGSEGQPPLRRAATTREPKVVLSETIRRNPWSTGILYLFQDATYHVRSPLS